MNTNTLDRLKSILKEHKETQLWRQKRILEIRSRSNRLQQKQLQTGDIKPNIIQQKEPTSSTAAISTAIIPSNALMLDDDDDILASISSARQQLLTPLSNPSFQTVQSQTWNENENDDDDDEFSTTLEQVIQPPPQQQQQQKQKDSIGENKTMTTKNPITKTRNIIEESISPPWEIKVPQKINSISNTTNTNGRGIGISNSTTDSTTDVSWTKQQKQSTTSSTAAYGIFGTGTNESLDIY